MKGITMSILRSLSILALALLLTIGCGSGSDSTKSRAANYDFSAALERTVVDVIEPTYKDLAARATSLRVAAEAFAKSPTQPNLDAARAGWVATRRPWEQSEAFLFGPVSDLALDGALDSWPVDAVQLDSVLASSIALTPETIKANLGGGLKGFHTIEYLLWGADGRRTADSLAAKPREVEYLIALARALEIDTTTLSDAWTGDDGYGRAFLLAGKPGGRFYRQADAVQQLVNGMAAICDEVANGKIADPFKEGDPMLVESQFSFNSIEDFANNIRSVQHVYGGALSGVGAHSVSSFVREHDRALDARLQSEIDAAIKAIYAISSDGQPFAHAIKDPGKRTAIEEAQARVRTVMTTLRRDVLPLIVG